jgi:hypothetical protein
MLLNPAQSLLMDERFGRVPEEHNVGGHFEGESARDQRAGKDRMVTCTIYKRAKDGSYFMRVSIKSKGAHVYNVKRQANCDIDRYASESDLMKVATILGVNAAIDDMEKNPGVMWDLGEIGSASREALREFFVELDGQGSASTKSLAQRIFSFPGDLAQRIFSSPGD